MLVVYRATPSPRSWNFGLGVRCATWREARPVRERIAKDAMTSKDNSIPIVYDEAGNFIVAGWQSGFAS